MRLWRLSDDEGECRWSGYTWLAAGETAEDAMRTVVAQIKAANVRYAFGDPTPIPDVMWAVPLGMPDRAIHLDSERSEIGEQFEDMFDYEAQVEVRL